MNKVNKKYLIILLIIFSITLLVIPLTAQNTKTFQIASAGSDGIFGTVDDVYTVGGKVNRGISPHNVNESLTAAFSGKKKKDKSQPAIPEGYIEISTAEQLASIGTDENYPLGGSYFMTADIDLSGYSNWNPIGNYGADSESKFTGIFDGNNHVISNLTINFDGDYKGLFGYISETSEITNLGLENANITGRNYIGGLVGRNGGTLTNCYVAGNITGDWHTGGLVGENNGALTNCYATGEVTGNYGTGGLVGCNSTGCTIENCYATGEVTGDEYTGGLVGYTPTGCTIKNCYATGSVTGGSDTGGLVGQNFFSSITSCYATGKVTGTDLTGGLVGSNFDGTLTNCYATGEVKGGSNIGGLVGCNFGTITNCYATGNVSGSYTGGLVGSNYSTITNSYYNSETTGRSDDDGRGTPLTTAEMKQQSNFSDWDFDTVWDIDPGTSYPYLIDNEQIPYPGIN
jgi:hypothetical protein